MKKFIVTALSIAALCACSLNEPDGLFIKAGDACKNIQQCDAAVTAAYSPLNTLFSYRMGIAIEGCTDLMYIASGTQDAQMDISPANARFGNTVWEYAYAGIRNANYAVWGMERSGLDAGEIAPLIAEAKTMRAFYYLVLTSFFGDVPFYEDYVGDKKTLEKVRRLPRMSADETRAALIAELQSCVDYLPAGRTYDLGIQRAGAAFCYMVIAKMALWNKDWQAAIAALEKIAEMYGELTEEAYPLADLAFSRKNTPEDIFEIQHTYTPGGLQYYSNYASICMPYPLRKDDSDGTVGFDGKKDNKSSWVLIPELGTELLVWQPLRPNALLYNGLYVRGGRDRRTAMNVIWEWNGQTFSRSWLGPKFWCYGMYNTYDSNNYPIFRYADAVLMLAEAYNAAGRHEDAIDCLNAVKERAGISPYGTFTTEAKLLDEIQMERGRELLGEFHRKFDLVRWGLWYKRTYEFTDYAKLKNNIRPYHEYYPIPDTEVALSGGALDNKAYEN